MALNAGGRENIHSTVCRTISDIEDWIEMYGPAGKGMLDEDTLVYSYNSEFNGLEFMWSPGSNKWYIAEVGE